MLMLAGPFISIRQDVHNPRPRFVSYRLGPGPKNGDELFPTNSALEDVRQGSVSSGVAHGARLALLITKTDNYKPRFPISSYAPCALASLFTSVHHYLEKLVHYLVSLSYKPVQTTSLHIRRSMFYNDMRFVVRIKARTAPRHSAYNSQHCSSPTGMIIHLWCT